MDGEVINICACKGVGAGQRGNKTDMKMEQKEIGGK